MRAVESRGHGVSRFEGWVSAGRKPRTRSSGDQRVTQQQRRTRPAIKPPLCRPPRLLLPVFGLAAGAVGPFDDLELAVVVLDHGGAALHPVAAIDVANAVVVVDDGMVDVPADHPVGGVPLRLGHQRLLELADEIHRVLDLQLGPLRERPIRKAQAPAQRVEDAVGRDGEVVGLVAQEREPARLGDHQVEMIAMDDQIAAPVGAFMHRLVLHLDAAEMRAVIVAQELVVIAGQIDDAHALAGLAQELLHHVVVGLRPIPARPQLPAVDDVAHQIDHVGVVVAHEVEEALGLAALGAQMHVGNEQRAEPARAGRHQHARGPSLMTRQHAAIPCRRDDTAMPPSGSGPRWLRPAGRRGRARPPPSRSEKSPGTAGALDFDRRATSPGSVPGAELEVDAALGDAHGLLDVAGRGSEQCR